jgi:hypothetical protein
MPMARPVSDGLQAHHAAPRSSQRVRCDVAALIGALSSDWHVPEDARLYGAAGVGPIVLKE